MQTHSNQTTIPPVIQNSTTGQRSSRWRRRGVCVWNWRLPACLPYQRHLWPVNLSLKTHDHTTLTLQHNGQLLLLLLLCVWLAHYIFYFTPKEVSTARDRERFSGGHCARFLSAAEPTEQEQGEAVPPYKTTYHSQPATIAVEYPQYKNPIINNSRQTGDMIYKQIEESGRQMTSLAYGELPRASEIGRLKPPKTTTSACLFISLHG